MRSKKNPVFNNGELDALLELLAYADAGNAEEVGMDEIPFRRLKGIQAKILEAINAREESEEK